MKEDRYFKSSSFPLVVFLFTKGEQIAGVNQTSDPSKKEFALVFSPRLEELVDLYKFGDRNDPELGIQVHTYEHARKELLDRLRD